MPKRQVGGHVVAKTYDIMSDAVEAGIRAGWARAHKHTDKPDEETIRTAIFDYVMSQISERFSFPEDR